MLATLLIPLAMAGGIGEPTPIDPDTEVLLVTATFDETAVCPPFRQVVPMLGNALGDYQLAIDMIVAYGVEVYEENYGQNLTEEGEQALIGLMEDCL